jgi:(E)-4-hydroxy-3-methylbut-2-enyl-diphosphate synthase
MKYCTSISETKRWKTRTVMVGNVGVGGDNPVRIQSMTTSNTRDAEATAEQIIRLADSGCEIARVTVQGMKEADSCGEIKNLLVQKGYTIPLVADIHFYPPAAMHVADFVDKIRINPGNFVDKRAQFKVIEYDDATYAEEIARIEEKFTPLVEKCKKLKRAMRIGTNHGSLSDRIMSRYGDTPKGMVESALEFTRVARALDYHDMIFSMKASNPQVMIQAYRLLVAEMMALGWDYPLHLGVTEAGEGEDGRVKSSIGIGSLLLDGLGDTIRVSLTEDPWCEIDPCSRLVKFAKTYQGRGVAPFEEKHRRIDIIERRKCDLPTLLHRDGSVLAQVNAAEIESADFYANIGCKVALGRPLRDLATCDALVVEGALSEAARSKLATLQRAHVATIDKPYVVNEEATYWKNILEHKPEVIFFAPQNNRLHNTRKFFDWMQTQGLKTPIILSFHYTCSEDDLVIESGAEMGALLCDGIGEGVMIKGNYPLKMRKDLGFTILQGARMRSSKTEFISCPGCGRTLFDLQKVAAKIREKTAHLPGVKIAIMGCIVNGPGEMADADFGYVGSKPGKIDLYVGKQCVERDIEMQDAEERLVDLIKRHGRWQEKEEAAPV